MSSFKNLKRLGSNAIDDDTPDSSLCELLSSGLNCEGASVAGSQNLPIRAHRAPRVIPSFANAIPPAIRPTPTFLSTPPLTPSPRSSSMTYPTPVSNLQVPSPLRSASDFHIDLPPSAKIPLAHYTLGRSVYRWDRLPGGTSQEEALISEPFLSRPMVIIQSQRNISPTRVSRNERILEREAERVKSPQRKVFARIEAQSSIGRISVAKEQASAQRRTAAKASKDAAKLQTARQKAQAKELQSRNALAAREAAKAEKMRAAAEEKELRESRKRARVEAEHLARLEAAEAAKQFRDVITSGAVQEALLAEQAADSSSEDEIENDTRILRGGPVAKKRKTRARKSKTFLPDSTDPVDSLLKSQWDTISAATDTFPPEVPPKDIRRCIQNFLGNMNALAAQKPCAVCGRSWESASITTISRSDRILLNNVHRFDKCARNDDLNTVDLCKVCLTSIQNHGSESIPKFSGKNDINTSLCDDYPACLLDLTPIEEACIARSKVIGFMLRITHKNKGICYKSASGHIMAYRQNPSKLFDILPSPELNLAEYVTVSWERPKPTGIPSDAPSRPSDAVLAKFCQVRKAKVLAALEWLCLHNPLYKDVKINRELLATWKESFIPEILITSAIITDRKLSDNRDGYAYDRDADTTEFGARATEQEEVIYEDDNDEILSDQIEFNGSSDSPRPSESDSGISSPLGPGMEHTDDDYDPTHISTGAFISDQENQNVSLKESQAQLFAELQRVHEEAGKENLDGSVTVPHIEYKQAFGIETFNSWTDYNYLLAAFPTVFPYGRGGHVQADRAKRPISVDLQEYANWLMRHHNCQAAKHHILPYVLYDMILLRQSSTGNIVQSRNEYWAHGQVDIMSLTSEDLQRAAKEMAAGGRCSNPVINRLLVNVRLVSSYNPESFGKKLAMRHVLMGHVVLHGAPAFWFTINPTDLNSPLVLRMAGVHVTPHLTKAQLSDLRRRSAMGNPGLVAQYFDNVIQSFFKHLLCSATEKVGILGPIVSHFGVVETNARKMHHLHGFAWLAGNIDFDKLGARVIRSPDFRNRLASYLTSVVTEQIDLAWGERYREEYPDRQHFYDCTEYGPETFIAELEADANSVACKHQMHSHTQTCFKDQKKMPVKDADGNAIPGRFTIYCRFLYPRPIIPKLVKDPETGMDVLPEGLEWLNPGCGVSENGSLTWSPSTGEIFLPRNNPRLNRRNNAISSCIRSNHDIQWIPGSSRMLSALYYMFNYSTKDDVKMHNLVLTAALFKTAMERAKAATGPLTPAQQNLMKVQPGDFCMKVYHKFQREREVSAITVCAFLQKLPLFYMPREETRIIQLYQVTTHLRKWAAMSRGNVSGGDSDEQDESRDQPDLVSESGEALVSVDTRNMAPGFSKFTATGSPNSMAVNYELRGPRLEEFCVYEYVAQIGIETVRSARKGSFSFYPEHPKFSTHRQYSRQYKPNDPNPSIWVPAIHGTLTRISNRGKSARDILADSPKAENDIDECLLGLFVPWNRFPQLFKEYASDTTLFPEPRDACSLIWSHIYPKLHPRLQKLSTNLRLLRRSKEAAEKDRQARALERDLWEENATFGVEDMRYQDEFDLPDIDWSTELSTEDFQHGFLNAIEHWQQRKTGLGAVSGSKLEITASSLLGKSSIHGQDVGITYHAETARNWKEMYKSWDKSSGEPLQILEPETTPPDLPGHTSETGHGLGRGRGRSRKKGRGRPRGSRNKSTVSRVELEPQLRQLFVDPGTLDGLKSLYATDPGLNKLMSVIRLRYKLNEKQRLTVCVLLGRAMDITDFATVLEDQTLAYIGGQGGTGKTMLTAGFLLGMEILGRSDEVLIVASTGSAASHIGGATIHAAMGIGGSVVEDSISTSLQKMRAQHSKIRFMLVDEVSMIGQSVFGRVHLKAEKIWKPPTDSGTVLGGIPCVITLGDFHQFQPVQDPAFWATTSEITEQQEHGLRVWRCFNDVVILTEQMRQKDDLHYQGLLERAKTVSLTNADIDFLNSKTRAEKESRGEPIPGTAIRTLNEERHDFNRLAIEKFAMDHGQRIWLFPATHSRSRASLGQARISVATMLAIGDTTAYKGPGILFFTPNMPFMLLANVGTRVGLTNGKMGKAIDVVMDDHATFFELDDRYILCNKPPICVLVDFGEPCGLQYPGLPMNLQPIFQYSSSGRMKDLQSKVEASVQRQQIPGTPAFAITDFKSQGHTKEELETDLSFSKMPGRRSHHYRWTSLNVQLGRLTSSQGLCLREKITRQDVSYYPDLELSAEIERLEILAVESWGRWNEEIRKRGVVFESGRET